MPSASRSIQRPLALLLLTGALLATLPVTPVVATEIAPATTSAVVDELPESPAATPAAATSVSEPVRAPIPFTTLGVHGPEGAAVELRWADEQGAWSDWFEVEWLDLEDGPDAASRERADAERRLPDGVVSSDAIWTGPALDLQVRVTGGELDELDVHTIDAMGLSESLFRRVARTLGSMSTAPAEASSSYAGLVTRRGWGANESIRRGSPSYATPRFAVLHHTAGNNSYSRAQAPAVVRGIYDWHVRGNGWSDMGYNILVDRYGTVYEGRFGGFERGVVGAHASGWNAGSIGVSIMGNFEVAAVPDVAVQAASRVIAWKYRQHGIDPSATARVTANGRSIPTLVGHRDVGSTSCPGRYVYSQMGRVRGDVARFAASIPVPAPPPAPTPPPPPAEQPPVVQPPVVQPPVVPPPVVQPPVDTTPVQPAAGVWAPLVGDWNGDGRSTPGRFRDGRFELSNGLAVRADVVVAFGRAGDRPVVGDWNGDGRDSVGVVRGDAWLLRDRATSGPADRTARFEPLRAADVAVTGDWNGDGRDGIGLVRGGEWLLRNRATSGAPDHRFVYGRSNGVDVPLVGDWNRDGRDGIGIVRDGTWHLRHRLGAGVGDHSFVYGRVLRGDVPLVGDWNRNRQDTPGIVRSGRWLLRLTLGGGLADVVFE